MCSKKVKAAVFIQNLTGNLVSHPLRQPVSNTHAHRGDSELAFGSQVHLFYSFGPLPTRNVPLDVTCNIIFTIARCLGHSCPKKALLLLGVHEKRGRSVLNCNWLTIYRKGLWSLHVCVCVYDLNRLQDSWRWALQKSFYSYSGLWSPDCSLKMHLLLCGW